MRSLALSVMFFLSACVPSASDYPTPEGAAGAIARAGYFGPIEEWYSADIFRAHPDVREFVRSVSCRARQDDSVACVVEIAGTEQLHDLVFCRCGGGGVHDWSMVSDIDDPALPKIEHPLLNEADFQQRMRTYRDEALRYERETIYPHGDGNGYFRRLDALRETKAFYRRLAGRERAFAARELSDWLLAPDALLRDQTIQLIDELCIRGTDQALEALLTRETEQGVLEKIRHAQDRLSNPSCRPF